jgi:glycosyltransferase involved in cell wall biosynthesis
MQDPVFFFLPDVTGGVASVVCNIVQYTDSVEREIKVIACRDIRDTRTAMIFPGIIKGVFHRFQYDSRGNFYYTVRRLRKIINKAHPVIVATDSLELEMVQLTGVDEKVVFIVLGDFDHYYGLAEKHSAVINGFIAISNEIYTKLIALLPARKEDISLAYFPTPIVNSFKSVLPQDGLRVIFAARLDAGKQPLLLLQINNILKKKGIKIKWTIVGDGPLGVSFKQQAAQMPEFVFTGTVSNHDLHALYLKQDVFIMTSELEGLPVSLIEAMKTGLVPVVSDIPGGIREIVIPGTNGFLCSYDSAPAFADRIEQLATSPVYYEQLSRAARETAEKKFNPIINSKHYFDIIDSIPFVKGNKQFTKRTANRLDKVWLPNLLVKWIRNFRTGYNLL